MPLLCAGLPLVLFGCSDGGNSGSSQPTACSGSRDTPAYTWAAADASSFFRWTCDSSHIQYDVFIYADVDDRPQSVPPGFDPPSAAQAYNDARTQWRLAMAASGLAVESLTQWLASEPANPENRAKMIVSFVDTIPSPPNAVGLTSVQYTGNRVDVVRIQLALRRQSGAALSAAERRAVALHEYGHALGFQRAASLGHSNETKDVMYPAQTCSWTTLSEGDERSIVELYHTSPVPRLGEGYVQR